MNRLRTRGTKHVRRYRPAFGMTASQNNPQSSASALCSTPRTSVIVPILPPGPTGGCELPNPVPSSTTVTDRSTNTLPRRTTFLPNGIVVQAQAVLGPQTALSTV